MESTLETPLSNNDVIKRDHLKARILFIDIAKCIAMFLVIHNHFLMDYGNGVVKIVIASFHMPLFFMLSGLTIKTPNSYKDVLLHIFNRVIRMMLPFYLWCFLYSGFSYGNVFKILWGSNTTIALGGAWFIPCFFIADILCTLSLWALKKRNKLLLLPFIVVFFAITFLLKNIDYKYGLPFTLGVSFAGAAFICLGKLLWEFHFFEWVEKRKIYIQALFLSLAFGLTFVLAYFNKSGYDNDYHRIVMALSYFGNYFMFIGSGLFGSIFVIVLSMMISKFSFSKALAKIGQFTFVILMMQQIAINALEKGLSYLSLPSVFIIPIFGSIVVLLFCYAVGWVITKVFPNLKGDGILSDLSTRLKS